jgi:2-polyprenyl-3-methyl-5-hydroxy-6-metoxy-1,4-benzoquinol methylase/spore maturation protein CgeB
MNNDRVAELYKGEIHANETQRVCRDRIHWMCGEIRGPRVVDVGCSQGIASILAARAGHRVVGVDVEEPAIAYARRMLLGEAPDVQERAQFVLADILEDDLAGQRFDTVLLGEILEHHADPRRLFERAVGLLVPGGTIVVTTPFGYHPHEDHKVTFYLSDFASTIENLCQPVALDIADGYIRLVGRHRDAALVDVMDLSPARLLSLSEKAFHFAEQILGDDKRRILRARAEFTRALKRIEKLEEQLQHQTSRAERARERVAALDERKRELLDRLAEQRKLAGAALRLPPILPAPAGAGVLTRGLSMLLGSLQHEIHLGRALRRPHTAVLKTVVRVSRAMRAPSGRKQQAAPAAGASLAPAEADGPAPSPEPSLEVKEIEPPIAASPRFPSFEPLVSPGASSLTIATILDTFSEFCFRYEANLVPLPVDAWREELERHRPCFLFCESAWRGNNGQWRFVMTRYASRPDNPLRALLAWCKEQGIPRVFWNKEDPPNFDVFKDVAMDFDFVFTSDEMCIPRYRELLGHDRIYALPFAAQPAIHNPIQEGVERAGTVCFAGSWRADKYPERVTDSEALLGPALEYGLDIFDRNANTKKLAFPAPYRDAVRGSLDYDAMLSAYRGYQTFLNVNSVKDSPTMFARRVFELMACGTPVISSDSVGIRTMLGSLVKIASTSEEARGHLEQLLGDANYRHRFAHAGYREVLENHTYAHRLRAILDAVGIESPRIAPPRITILAASNRPDHLDNLLGSLRRQIYPNIEVILLLNSDSYDRAAVEREAADLPRLKVFQLPEAYTLAECLNHGLDHSAGDWIAKMDDDDYYGPHYLSDLMLATRYTDARVLGKRNYFCYVESRKQLAIRFADHEHRHVEFVLGATLLVHRDVFDEIRFSPVTRGTDTVFQDECRERGIRIYSTDPFNFILVRRADAFAHTWQISDEQFLSKCRIVSDGLAMDKVMI